MLLYTIIPSVFSDAIVSLTDFANVVDNISLYEPVITFSLLLFPKTHSTNFPAVLDLPCLGGIFITQILSSLS